MGNREMRIRICLMFYSARNGLQMRSAINYMRLAEKNFFRSTQPYLRTIAIYRSGELGVGIHEDLAVKYIIVQP
jgi:hypothetical protein